MSTPHDPAEDLQGLPWPEEHVQPSEACTRAIRERCTRDMACAGRQSRGARAITSIVVVSAVVGSMLGIARLFGVREGWTSAALRGALGWSAVLVGVLFLGLTRPPGRRGPRLLRLGVALGLPIAFLSWLSVSGTERLALGEFVSQGHAGYAFGCGSIGLIFGALSGLGVLFAWRGTDPFTPGLSGALAGLVGGVGGALGLGLVCPCHEGWHLVIGHGAIVLAAVAGGAGLGRRWLAP